MWGRERETIGVRTYIEPLLAGPVSVYDGCRVKVEVSTQVMAQTVTASGRRKLTVIGGRG